MDGGTGIHFRILGRFDVMVDGHPVTVPPGRLRLLLAAFIVSAGLPAPASVLAGRLWPERAPQHERAAVHTYVARLRRLLGREVIQTVSDGYRLAVTADQIDLWDFRDLLQRASATVSAPEELALLRQASRLWRGRPFTGLESTWLEREVIPRLEDEWASAAERRIDLEMQDGQWAAVIPELRDLVSAHPTRESWWLRLIDALHRSGRRAEALEAYPKARAALIAELGVEPGEALQQTHRRVLSDGAVAAVSESSVGPAPTIGVARQLPHDLATFCSRAEMAPLRELMTSLGYDDRRTHILALDGAPGIGKTTLAVHFAHQIAAGYPDLQLYVNLRGYGPGEPVSPAEAMETLLRSLGVRSDLIPPKADERAAMLRGTLAGRRVLMLLDNARHASQVRPLLPGADSLVIVTSRNQLRGLSVRDGAHRVTLAPLRPHEALDLLATAFGPDRVTAEQDAADQLVELCDGFPLALAIVAERARRSGGLANVVRALLDERARLDVFGDRDSDPYNDLWVALSWSYRTLDHDAADMFRSLGRHPAGAISLATAAALAGVSVRRAAHVLDQLVAAHLVQQRSPQRYELHNLLRWYAVVQAGSDDGPLDRDRTVRRMLDWYLHAALAADSRLLPHRRREFVEPYQAQTEPPQFADVGAAMEWFELEYDNLRSIIRWAYDNGWSGHAWRIVTSMTTFFERRMPWPDAIDFHQWALDAAAGAEEQIGAGYLLNSLGYLRYLKGDRETATVHLDDALNRFQDAGHTRGEVMVLGNLGLMYGEQGDHAMARWYATRALGDANGEASNQHHLGLAYLALGSYQPAQRAFRRFEALVRVDVGRALFLSGYEGLAHAVWEGAVATLTDFDHPQARQVSAAIADLAGRPIPVTDLSGRNPSSRRPNNTPVRDASADAV